ncbi:hypothetical protein [Mesorhizobium marinum]|uniref:hypothetical protein n=1 Tax=Mesorhizobium marinum TaxID=3228790 RepID=UPI0034668AA7
MLPAENNRARATLGRLLKAGAKIENVHVMYNFRTVAGLIPSDDVHTRHTRASSVFCPRQPFRKVDVQEHDVFSNLAFHGHHGTNFTALCLIRCRAEGVWSPGKTPAYIEFSTGTTVIAARMRIHSVGGVTLGSPTGGSTCSTTLPRVPYRTQMAT